MAIEDKYFQTLTEDELWKRYCGFLDLSIDEFMDIQNELLRDEIELVADSVLGKKIMNNQKPKTVEELRQMVPITTYDDYEPYLSEHQDDALAIKPYLWCHSAGRGGRYKWFPASFECLEKCSRNFLASWILAFSKAKGEVSVVQGLRNLANLPPPPYASGSYFQFCADQFSFQVIPPTDIVQNMTFQERMQKGFEIALRDGVDVLTGISSVLVKIGEGFAEKTRKKKFSVSDLHPKVMFRFLRAIIRSKREKRPILPKDLWSPRAVLCGGLDTQLYKQDVAYYWGVEPFDFYISTETMFIAMQAWNKKAMTFIPDAVFLEFIPREDLLKHKEEKDYQPSTVLLNELEEGKLYEVIITQFHGLPLLRYRMDDIIKVVSLKDEEAGINLPQFLVQGKVGSTIDLAGLCELDEKTVWQSIANTGIKYYDWSACKEYDQNQTLIHLYIELKEEKQSAEVANRVDEQLKIVDTDYKDIDNYLQLQPVRVTLLSPGTFQRYMDEKVKEGADLAHLKPTHMNAPPAVIQRLLQLSEVTKEK